MNGSSAPGRRGLPMPLEDTDIVVVGAGAVGLTLAILAARRGFSVIVLERGGGPPTPDAAPTNDESRVYALSPASIGVLAAAGAWPVGTPWFTPGVIAQMHVYEDRGHGRLDFEAGTAGLSDLARVVPHGMLMRALGAALADTDVTLVTGCAPSALAELDPGSRRRRRLDALPTEVVGAGRSFSAGLVVGADGVKSQVRELAAVATRGREYGQHGVTAVLELRRPHGDTALQHFRDGDVVALLPLADPERAVLVWSCADDTAAALARLSDAEFAQTVNEAFGSARPEVSGVLDRQAFPLRWMLAEHCVRRGIVLVGDAAHTIHPLAGQGLNLGLMDAAALIDTLDALDGAPSFRTELARFERWRKSEALTFKLLTDGLFRTFSLTGLGALRGIGMNAVDRAGPVKRWLIGRAAGTGGDLPSLARAGTPPV